MVGVATTAASLAARMAAVRAAEVMVAATRAVEVPVAAARAVEVPVAAARAVLLPVAAAQAVASAVAARSATVIVEATRLRMAHRGMAQLRCGRCARWRQILVHLDQTPSNR